MISPIANTVRAPAPTLVAFWLLPIHSRTLICCSPCSAGPWPDACHLTRGPDCHFLKDDCPIPEARDIVAGQPGPGNRSSSLVCSPSPYLIQELGVPTRVSCSGLP